MLCHFNEALFCPGALPTRVCAPPYFVSTPNNSPRLFKAQDDIRPAAVRGCQFCKHPWNPAGQSNNSGQRGWEWHAFWVRLGRPTAAARRRHRMGGGAMMPSARGKHPAAALPPAFGDRCSHRARRPAGSGVVVARSVRGPGCAGPPRDRALLPWISLSAAPAARLGLPAPPPPPPAAASPWPPFALPRSKRCSQQITMVGSSSGPALPFHKLFTASAIAACTAEITTLPLGEMGGLQADARSGAASMLLVCALPSNCARLAIWTAARACFQRGAALGVSSAHAAAARVRGTSGPSRRPCMGCRHRQGQAAAAAQERDTQVPRAVGHMFDGGTRGGGLQAVGGPGARWEAAALVCC